MKPTASLGALLLVLAGTACEAQPVAEPGPEAGSGPRSVDAAASREDPATVLDRFLRAYAVGDGDRACDLVTAAHAESIRVDGFAVADSCAEAVMSNAWVLEELGAPERYEITVTRMDAAVAELAVAYPATGARRRTSETWSMSREDGRWLVAGES